MFEIFINLLLKLCYFFNFLRILLGGALPQHPELVLININISPSPGQCWGGEHGDVSEIIVAVVTNNENKHVNFIIFRIFIKIFESSDWTHDKFDLI